MRVWCAHGGGECHLPLCHLVLLQVAGLVSKETYQVNLGWHKTLISTLACQILKVYIEGLTEFSQLYGQCGLDTLPSQGYVLWQLPAQGEQVEHTFQGQEWGWGAPHCPRPGHRSNGQSHLISNHLQQFYVHLRY